MTLFQTKLIVSRMSGAEPQIEIAARLNELIAISFWVDFKPYWNCTGK